MVTIDAFRVGEIQELTRMANCRWIPTKVNVTIPTANILGPIHKLHNVGGYLSERYGLYKF